MFKKSTFAAALLAATVISGVASAKTFVYCSEASPAHFDPGPVHRRQRLSTPPRTRSTTACVEFKKGTTDVEPAPRRELTTFPMTACEIHLPSCAPGVKFHTTALFHADPRPQRGRRDLLVRAPVEGKTTPGTSLSAEGAVLGLFRGHGHAQVPQVRSRRSTT